MSGESPQESGGAFGGPQAGGEPSEEELRAAYEAELSRLTSADVMLNAALTLLSVGDRRLGPPPGAKGGGGAGEEGRDLEQVREAIDGARALLGVLERRFGKELAPLREALSQLQLAYAREMKGSATSTAGARAEAPQPQTGSREEPAPPAGRPEAGAEEADRPPGPAESSGRLWVPGR